MRVLKFFFLFLCYSSSPDFRLHVELYIGKVTSILQYEKISICRRFWLLRPPHQSISGANFPDFPTNVLVLVFFFVKSIFCQTLPVLSTCFPPAIHLGAHLLPSSPPSSPLSIPFIPQIPNLSSASERRQTHLSATVLEVEDELVPAKRWKLMLSGFQQKILSCVDTGEFSLIGVNR